MVRWLFIHGAASTRLTWTRQVGVYKYSVRVELPFLPDEKPEHLISSYAQFCLSQSDEPVVAIGHSMGGAIALTMALTAPDRVKGLILAGTGPRLPVNAALLDALKTDPRTALQKVARWSLRKSPDPGILANSLAQIANIPGERAYQEFSACNTFDITDKLSRITCPVALIRGKEDRMTPEALTSAFVETWSDMPVYDIPQAGHLMMLEQPSLFNDALRDIPSRDGWKTPDL